MKNHWHQPTGERWSPVHTTRATTEPTVTTEKGLLLRVIAFIQSAEQSLAERNAATVTAHGGWPAQVRNGLVFALFDSAQHCFDCCRTIKHAQIGISSGDVLVSREQVLGLPVIEASRLMGAASTNSMWCIDRFVELLDPLAAVEFSPVQTVPIKGMQQPVAIYVYPAS